MGISGKDVQVWMWTAVKFSMRCAFSLIKNHPFVSCPVLFFLVLYICFPSIFWISVYFSAFLVLVVAVAKLYIGHQNAKSFRNRDAKSIKNDGFPRNRSERPYGRARSVRRRRPYETSRESSLHTREEDEKTTVSLSTFNSEMMVDKSSFTEEKPKEIKEIQVDSVTSNGDSLSSDVSLPFPHKSCGRSRKFGSRDVEIESSEGEDEEEEEDEQDREANNKAVQWTETDQKNLMDLGLSEIERNKRLESLIARRRARKMLSLQVRRPAPKLDNLENHGLMTSLTIPRNTNSLLATPPSSNLFSPMPGSAPSVLLPDCNPFDLPYDAQEEKPNLTGGSFQLEFKDITLAKPENVGSGASAPKEQKEDQQQTSLSHDSIQNEGVSEGIQNFQVKEQLDEKDTCKIIEVEVCRSPKSKLNTVTTIPIIEGEEEVSDSKQESDLVYNCQEENNGAQTEDYSEKLSSASSSDEGVSVYKVDKDAVLRSLGSQLVRSMSINREERPLFEKKKMLDHLYLADKGLRLNLHTPMSSIASDLQVEVSEVSSPMLADDDIHFFPDDELSVHKEGMKSDGYRDIRKKLYAVSWIRDNEPKEVYNTMDIGFSGRKDSEDDNLSFPVMDKMQQLKEEPVAGISQNDDSEKPEQSPYPSLMSKGEFSSKVVQNTDEEFNIRAADDKTDLLIEQGNREPTKLPETSRANSVDCTGNQPEKIVEPHSMLEPVDKNVDAKVCEDIEAESEDSKKDKTDGSTAIQDNDTRESIQVDEEEHDMEEMRSSGVHPHLRNRQIPEPLPELVLLPQFHVTSSTFSPTSVLQPNISLDPISLSRFSVEVHQIQPERVENSMLDEAIRESSSSAQSASRAETLKKSSNDSTSTVEANSIGSVQQDMETSNLIAGTAHENDPEVSCRKLDPDTKEVSSNSLSSNRSEAALSNTEGTNSAGIVSNETKDDRNLTVTNDSCDELGNHKAENEALPGLHNPNREEQMKMNAPAESSIEEEINSNPNTDKTVVTED